MVNFDFSDNAQLRKGETEQLPIFIGNSEIYFLAVNQDNLQVCTYNCDVRGMNNLHHMLDNLEDGVDGVLLLAVWHGQYQSHSFLCDKKYVKRKLKSSLGDKFCDELQSNLAY